jgi:hypothetical protein
LLLTCAIVCAGQASDGVHGHVFRNNAIGLTYAFPETFSAKVESELPMRDSTGREHLILALWTTPERVGPPRMAFLHDSKPRAADLSRAEIANRYLAAIRQLWVNVRGVKMFGPQKIVFPGCDAWRLDVFQPDGLPHYNAAVVIPLADRSLLAVQINAPSQKEVDEEVDSLRELRLDRKQP